MKLGTTFESYVVLCRVSHFVLVDETQNIESINTFFASGLEDYACNVLSNLIEHNLDFD